MIKKLDDLAKEIIKNNQYLTLSTIGNNKTWTCIVAYVFDKKYNFYYLSLPNSKHSKNILENNEVTFAIYNSTQDFGTGSGLQIEGVAREIEIKEIPNIAKLYFGRKYPYGNISNTFSQGLKQLLKSKIYKFYKLTPSHVWINDPNSETDNRVEIKI